MLTWERYIGSRRERPLTCLADVGELCVDPSRLSTFDGKFAPDHAIRFNGRKWWEWDYICSSADQLGLLNSRVTALGLGVGGEPLIFHFANYCKRVIATDLYSGASSWSDARFDNTKQILDLSPLPFPADRVSVENRDMRNTKAKSGSIDFVWSCSSIEHVPTITDLMAVFAEIHRILKVGGYAILTTEYCVTENDYLLPSVNAWNAKLFKAIVEALDGFEFVGETDLSFNGLHPGNAASPRRYPPLACVHGATNSLLPHLRGGSVANPAGLSLVAPIAFVLRKKPKGGVAPWTSLAVSEGARTYSEGVNAFFAKNMKLAREKLTLALKAYADDLQMQHMCWRYLVEIMARQGEMRDRETFEATLRRFQAIIPEGAVQDDDCLAMLAYLFGEMELYEDALDVAEKCLMSPSIVADHIYVLGTQYLRNCSLARQSERGILLMRSILQDLVTFGWPAGVVRQGAQAQFNNILKGSIRDEFSFLLDEIT